MLSFKPKKRKPSRRVSFKSISTPLTKRKEVEFPVQVPISALVRPRRYAGKSKVVQIPNKRKVSFADIPTQIVEKPAPRTELVDYSNRLSFNAQPTIRKVSKMSKLQKAMMEGWNSKANNIPTSQNPIFSSGTSFPWNQPKVKTPPSTFSEFANMSKDDPRLATEFIIPPSSSVTSVRPETNVPPPVPMIPVVSPPPPPPPPPPDPSNIPTTSKPVPEMSLSKVTKPIKTESKKRIYNITEILGKVRLARSEELNIPVLEVDDELKGGYFEDIETTVKEFINITQRAIETIAIVDKTNFLRFFKDLQNIPDQLKVLVNRFSNLLSPDTQIQVVLDIAYNIILFKTYLDILAIDELYHQPKYEEEPKFLEYNKEPETDLVDDSSKSVSAYQRLLPDSPDYNVFEAPESSLVVPITVPSGQTVSTTLTTSDGNKIIPVATPSTAQIAAPQHEVKIEEIEDSDEEDEASPPPPPPPPQSQSLFSRLANWWSGKPAAPMKDLSLISAIDPSLLWDALNLPGNTVDNLMITYIRYIIAAMYVDLFKAKDLEDMYNVRWGERPTYKTGFLSLDKKIRGIDETDLYVPTEAEKKVFLNPGTSKTTDLENLYISIRDAYLRASSALKQQILQSLPNRKLKTPEEFLKLKNRGETNPSPHVFFTSGQVSYLLKVFRALMRFLFLDKNNMQVSSRENEKYFGFGFY